MPITTLASYSVQRLEVLDSEGTVDKSLMPEVSADDIRGLYRLMVETRALDVRMLKLQRQGRLGTFPQVLGQEAAHIGAASACRPADWIVPAFRESGVYLMRGVPMVSLLQYWGGDERGALVPEGARLLPVSIPVGSHMMHAVGLAWAMKRDGEDAAALTFFGDGATSAGDFHEAMNLAAVFRAPVVFVCQNNHWAISIPVRRQTATDTIAQKAVAYGMPGIQVDGNDVFAMHRAVKEGLERALAGGGPTFIEAFTYRMSDHTTSDDAKRYRPPEELEVWSARDPLSRLAAYMKLNGLLDEAEEAAFGEEADEKVAEAVAAYEALDPPPPDEVFAHLYDELPPDLAAQQTALLSRVRTGV